MDQPPQGLPNPATTFIGREQELDALSALLRPPCANRLVTLTGAAGTGKTRLALQAVTTVVAHYPDGAAFVDLAALTRPEEVAPAILASLFLKTSAAGSHDASLIEATSMRQLILLLDNCEHLVDEVARVVDLMLAASPLLVVCCTSREPLGCAGERPLPVAPLPLPPRHHTHGAHGAGADYAALMRYDAVRLFCERAVQARPDFRLDEANQAAIAGICHHVDGIPLAIELAAAQMRYIAPDEVAARLHCNLHLLSAGRTRPARHQSLAAAVAWSYDLLTPLEQRLLRRLSIFARGFALEAVEAICADTTLPVARVVDLLTRLVDKSLVVAEQAKHGSRFRMLETVRVYCRDRLHEQGEEPEMLVRHAGYYAAVARRAHTGLFSAESQRWVQRIDDEYDNLRAAQAFLLGSSLPAAAQMAAHLTYYFIWRKRSGEALDLASALLEATQQPALAEVSALALLLRATVQLWLSELEAAYTTIRAAHAAALDSGVEPLQVRVRFMLACCAVYAGDEATAIPLLEELNEIGEVALGAWPVAVLYQVRGILQIWQGKLVLGCESLGESVRRMRAIGEPFGLCSPLHELGNVLLQLGKLDAAASAHMECHETSRRVGHRWIELLSMYALAEVETARGNLAQALEWYRDAAHGFAQVGQPLGPADARRLATLAAGARRWELVVRLHATADRISPLVHGVYGSDQQRVARELAQARTALGATRAASNQQHGATLSPATAIAQGIDELLRSVDPTYPADVDQLEVRVLGRVEVLVGKRPIEASQWKYTRSRDLLLFLLCRGGRATREELGETFWPDASAENQRNSLNVALYWLRKALGAREWVQFEADTYRVDTTRPIHCDLHEFDRLLHLAELERGSPRAALRRIEQALTLVRGSILEDVIDGMWHEPVRESMQQQLESVRLRAGALCIALDQPQAALLHLHAVATTNPLSEEACQGLMRAYARQGELGSLVRSYQALHTALAEELGVSPSAATRDLYSELVETLGGYSD